MNWAGRWGRSLAAGAIALGLTWAGGIAPARSQALLPYVVPLDFTRLEQQGLALIQEAAQLAQLQQYRQALARAEVAAQLAPRRAPVLSLLGSLYLQTGQIPQAIASLEQARRLEPNNAPVLFALGTAYFRQGQYTQAVTSLEAGLRIDGDNAGALFDLGNAHFRLRQYDRAIARYQSSLALDQEFWPSLNNIGLVRYEQGDTAGAIRDWEATLALVPNEPEPRLAIAVARYALGQQRPQAIQMGIMALEQDPRYGDPDFLVQNLWGARLIGSATAFLNLPQVRAVLAQR